MRNEIKNRKTLGDLGEELACIKLENMGYQIIDRNFHSKFGEVDLIGRKNEKLYFFEVKTRTSNRQGFPEEAVDNNKRRKIKNTINYYLLNSDIKYESIEFKVVAIYIDIIEVW